MGRHRPHELGLLRQGRGLAGLGGDERCRRPCAGPRATGAIAAFLHALRPCRGAHNRGCGGGKSRRRPHVRGRGPGRDRGPDRPTLRGSGRRQAERHDHGHGAASRGCLHRQCSEEPTARQSDAALTHHCFQAQRRRLYKFL